jgi:pyruvate ferredoxin oxidoreductase alpha subunit
MNVLDIENPKVFNPIVPPEYAMEMRYQLDFAMDSARDLIGRVDRGFEERFGRSYGGLFEGYMMDDAEMALVTLGTATTTARATVDELRTQGRKRARSSCFMRPFRRRS